VEARFAALEEEIKATTDDEVLANLVERAEELERLRAYIYPQHEIALQAATMLADMRDWGVPAEILGVIQRELIPAMKGSEINTQRAALHKLFDFYDAWEHHVTQYGSSVERQAGILLVGLLAAIIGGIVAVWYGYGMFGFIAGGLIGTLCSVLSKLPPMLGWGRWVAAAPRMYGRIGLGLAGTLAGGGLLATGAVSIIKSQQDFAKLLSTEYTASTGEALYLVAIGIVLGFTERMLASLAGAIVQRSPKQPPRSPTATVHEASETSSQGAPSTSQPPAPATSKVAAPTKPQ
jgi:hypothetical protein